jgi:hypothetical protein
LDFNTLGIVYAKTAIEIAEETVITKSSDTGNMSCTLRKSNNDKTNNEEFRQIIK